MSEQAVQSLEAALKARVKHFGRLSTTALLEAAVGIVEESAVDFEKATSSLAHTSLTSAFFGDPLPGRSALDKRQADSGIRSISLGGGAR